MNDIIPKHLNPLALAQDEIQRLTAELAEVKGQLHKIQRASGIEQIEVYADIWFVTVRNTAARTVKSTIMNNVFRSDPLVHKVKITRKVQS